MDELLAKLSEGGITGDDFPWGEEEEPTPAERVAMLTSSLANCTDNANRFLTDKERYETGSINPNPAIMFLIYHGAEMKKKNNVLLKKCPAMAGAMTNINPDSLINSIVRKLGWKGEDYDGKYINGPNDDLFFVKVFDGRLGEWDDIKVSNGASAIHAKLYEEANAHSKRIYGLNNGARPPQYVVWCLDKNGVKKMEGGALGKYTKVSRMKKTGNLGMQDGIGDGGIGMDVGPKEFTEYNYQKTVKKNDSHGMKWRNCMWIEYVEDTHAFEQYQKMSIKKREEYFVSRLGQRSLGSKRNKELKQAAERKENSKMGESLTNWMK